MAVPLQSHVVNRIIRATLGNSGIATEFNPITPNLTSIVVKAETGNVRIAWTGNDGQTLSEAYWVLPGGTATRLYLTPKTGSGATRNESLFLAGDSTNGAVVALQLEVSNLGSDG